MAGGSSMAKKKQETLQDIIDRIEEDLSTLRDKAQDLEDNQCECDDKDGPEDWSDDEDEEDDE